MTQFVPCTTSIKRASVQNVGNDRLLRRHAHLLDMMFTNTFKGSRHDFAMRAAELWAIECCLIARGFGSRKVFNHIRNHAEGRGKP